MIDHIGIPTADIGAARAFYEAALAPLNIRLLKEDKDGKLLHFGTVHPVFSLTAASGAQPIHIAFAAPDRAAVRAFHRAALAAGARDNGAPGLRPQYHPHYYGAFVIDPDGNNIEAVCHKPGEGA